MALAQDHPGRVSAFLKRADALAERFASKALIMSQLQIPRRFRLIGSGERDRLIESCGINTRLLRRPSLPALSWTGIVYLTRLLRDGDSGRFQVGSDI